MHACESQRHSRIMPLLNSSTYMNAYAYAYIYENHMYTCTYEQALEHMQDVEHAEITIAQASGISIELAETWLLAFRRQLEIRAATETAATPDDDT